MSNITAQAAAHAPPRHQAPQLAPSTTPVEPATTTTITTTTTRHAAKQLNENCETNQAHVKQAATPPPLNTPHMPPHTPLAPPLALPKPNGFQLSTEGSYQSSNTLKKGDMCSAALNTKGAAQCPLPAKTNCSPSNTCTTTTASCTTHQAKNGNALTEKERIEERNRKGRERSMRTRHRNASRLRLLQENCAYLYGENGLLREIVECCHDREAVDTGVIRGLLRRLTELRRGRPKPYVAREKGASGEGKGESG